MIKVISKTALIALCVCLLAGLTACEKVVIGEDEMSSGLGDGTARLSVMTRAGEPVKQGRIYVFDETGKCVSLLSTIEGDGTVTTQLPIGTYNVFAFGGDDLTRFTLPSQNEATTSSVIKVAEGKTLDDLFFEKKEGTLTNGKDEDIDLTLKRRVIQLTQVEIADVPKDVNTVDVTISSFYTGIQMNGNYPASPTEYYTVSLTKDADGTTWKATPNQLLFPSAGNPTIKVAMTTDKGNNSYSIATDTPMEANHKYSISGTNLVKQDVSLTATLTAADWDSTQSISFGFEESNVVWNPVAEQFANGYFVVSVNSEDRTAVLLAKKSISYEAPAAGSPSSAWIQAFESPMATLEKPAGVENNWRLPTLAEAAIFAKAEDILELKFTSGGVGPIYFYYDAYALGWIYYKRPDGNYEQITGTGDFGTVNILLRPVIDIKF